MTEEFDFRKLEADDGYGVDLVRSGDVLAEIFVYLKIEGRIAIREKLHSVKMPSFQDIADLKRRMIFYNGMVEYMNAGGTQAESMCRTVQDGMLGCLTFPGWDYFDHGVDTENNHVHEFISQEEPHRFVRWVRHEFIDTDLKEQDMLDEYSNLRERTGNTDDVHIVGHLQEG